MKVKTRNFNMTDWEIEKAFKGTIFGDANKRSLLAMFVLKKLCQYDSGNTLTCICTDLGFVTAKGNITNKGRMFLFNNRYQL
jgi:hypothetical protein